jgi:hypothetical protein
MSEVDANLTSIGEALEAFALAATASPDRWTTPNAPGKWSPSQMVEHVARSLEEAANDVRGARSKFPMFPGFVRPLVRGVFFNRVVRKGWFPKAKTSKAFDPDTGPATPSAGRERLTAALAKFDEASRARAASGQPVISGIFGAISVADYARFQEVHIRHHRKQLPS